MKVPSHSGESAPLHDGAQQRLIGLQLFMQLAADDAADEQAETYRAARRIVSAALADLRDLAHGIHPAALTDDGLMTGLRTLANRRGRERNPLDALTDREREILSLMAQGYSNDSIRNQLFISRRTVESHVSSVFVKLGIVESPESSRRVLAVLAYLQAERPLF